MSQPAIQFVAVLAIAGVAAYFGWLSHVAWREVQRLRVELAKALAEKQATQANLATAEQFIGRLQFALSWRDARDQADSTQRQGSIIEAHERPKVH
jgi:hypothetical protein